MKHERYIICPECKGTGKVNDGYEYGDSLEICDSCGGEGTIDNPLYYKAILPKKIEFKEGREAQLEYYNQKNNG